MSRLGNLPQPTGAARYAAPDPRVAHDAAASRQHDTTTPVVRDVDRVTLRLSPAARAKVLELYQRLRHIRRPMPTKSGIRMQRPSEAAIVEQLILAFDVARADELFADTKSSANESA